MNPLLAKIGRVAPNYAIGLATGIFLLTHRQATTSLAIALGSTGILWQAGIALFHLAVATVGLTQTSIKALHVNGWLHIACATTLLGYALGILLTPPALPAGAPAAPAPWFDQISTGAGLAIGAMLWHLHRWRQIEDEQIPGLRTLARLTATTGRRP